MKTFVNTASFVVSVFFLSFAASAGTFENLNAEQQKQVQAGEPVYMSESVQGAPWPRLTVYQRIEATPEEAAAVFTDYENHWTFMPDMVGSWLLKRHDARTVDINYEIRVPILKNERNTLRDTLSQPEAGMYRIDWKMIAGGTYARSIVGHVQFEPLGSATLMTYANLISASSLPGAQGKTMAGIRSSASALSRKIVKERTSETALLAKQVAELRKALAQ